MEPSTLEALLTAIADAWTIEAGAEITLEANPTSVEAGRFRDYSRLGINRVSLGVQSLIDNDLKTLGRLHTAAEAVAALDTANNIFDRTSFDLIYARPHQTIDQWRNELGRALAFGSRHLSLYQLTIEEGTPFAGLYRAGRLHVPDPELADELYHLTQEMTAAAGLPAYEISNHAAPGDTSRHNLLYWRYGEYAGIGPGAHGRIIRDGERHATSSERLPETWLARVLQKGAAFTECAALTADQQADELLLMGLRITEGVDLDRLAAVGNVRPASEQISELEGQGLLIYDRCANTIRATAAGRFILNRLVLELAASFSPT